MHRKNIKRPESLLLDNDSNKSAESLDSTPEVQTTLNPVAFKNSFAFKKSSKSNEKSFLDKKPSTRSVPKSPASPITQSQSQTMQNKSREKPFFEWSRLEVHKWVINLPELNKINKSQEISRIFLDNNVTGDILPFLSTRHYNSMNIKDLKTKLILRKNISKLVEACDDPNLDLLLSDAAISNSAAFARLVPIMEQTLNNLYSQIIKTHAVKLTSPITSNFAKSPVQEKGFERLDNDYKKLRQNFHRFKEEMWPILRQYQQQQQQQQSQSQQQAQNHLQSSQSSKTQFKNEQIYPLGNILSPGVASPMRNNISSPNFTSRRISEDDEESFADSTMFPSDNEALKKKVFNRKDYKDYDRSPIDVSHDDSFIPSPTTAVGMYNTMIGGSGSASNSAPNSAPNSATGTGPMININHTGGSMNGGNNGVSQPSLTSQQSNASFDSSITLSTPSAQSTPNANDTSFPSPTYLRHEPLKPLRAKYDDPCYKVLQKAMIKHKISNDWRNYVLVMCYNGRERILKPAEKPVKIFKELKEQGISPSFMLRQLEGASPSVEGFEDSTM